MLTITAAIGAQPEARLGTDWGLRDKKWQKEDRIQGLDKEHLPQYLKMVAQMVKESGYNAGDLGSIPGS